MNRPAESAAVVEACKLLVPKVAFHGGIFPTLDSCRNATVPMDGDR
jgi:hypothetical protein